MKSLSAAIALISLLSGSQTFGAEGVLDAPAMPDRPTVRTEVQRAHVASLSCPPKSAKYHLPWTIEAALDAYDYYECMDKLLRDAALRRTYSEAFEAGIRLDSAGHAAVLLEAHQAETRFQKSETAKTLQNLGRQSLERAIVLGKHLNVTPLQICEGGIVPAEADYVKNCRAQVIPAFVK